MNPPLVEFRQDEAFNNRYPGQKTKTCYLCHREGRSSYAACTSYAMQMNSAGYMEKMSQQQSGSHEGA